MASFYYACWLFAVQRLPGGNSGDTAEALPEGPANGGGGLFEGMGFFLPAMMIVMVLYFLFMLPKQQQRDQAKTSDMLNKLKKNDEVVTAGGILGTIVNIRDGGEIITIRVDENTNTKMKVLKKSVIRVLTGEEKKSD